MPGPRRSRARLVPAPLLVSLALAACGGGAGVPGGGVATGAAPASEEEWARLATPRPEPLAEAPRVSVALMEVVGRTSWSPPAGVDVSLGATELLAAGLLRRRDVEFVERRRFSEAADAERRGVNRPRGAPPAGTSSGAQYVASATWSNYGAGARLDVRLSASGTGEIVATWSAATPADADPVSLARLAVGGVLASLDTLRVRPNWADPTPTAASFTYRASGVPPSAATWFFQGLAAEEGWRWEAARAGYQNALAAGDNGFVEAAAALARTARLRNGGTLGRS